VGKEFKEANRSPGPWVASIGGFGECLPNPDNRISLHQSRKDAWGLPVAVIDCAWGPNELAIAKAAAHDARDMLLAAGATDITMKEVPGPPGNQAHDVRNLFVTDGACMASTACQNPSLTYMAITARAANHAADLLRDGQI
jgi:choline dehydrogenase-like flavoprotein